jgi:hypothetical protein
VIERRWSGRGVTASGALLAALIAAGAGTGGGAALAKTFSLSITGAEGARYAGRCTLTTASGEEETLELSGVVPRHERLEGDGLACRIEGDGRIVVEVARNGSRSRSATTGGVINISVR